jgi:CubicO group peptidase (beta-lactamase class C family)
MRTRTFLVVLSWVLVACLAISNTATADSQKQAAAIDRLFSPWKRADTPGCSLAVMRNGRIVFERGYGMADLAHDVKVTGATVFYVGSISKQFTAAALLMLVRDGKISLDDPIRKYVPELPNFGVPITLRQLLHHTSGLRDWQGLLFFDGWRLFETDLVKVDDVLHLMSRQKDLNFAPGSEFNYSNTNYVLLAQVVARVSGQSFPNFTASRLFKPLGMVHTHFRDNHAEVVKNLARAYEQKNGSFEVSEPNFDTVGETNLLTTVEDLALWDENFYTARVGGEAIVKQMHECGKLNDGTELNYAAGLFTGPGCSLKAVEHSGSDGGYVADMIRFPELQSVGRDTLQCVVC